MTYDHDDAAHGRRAILKNGLVLAGALAIPSAVSATQRLTARDLQFEFAAQLRDEIQALRERLVQV